MRAASDFAGGRPKGLPYPIPEGFLRTVGEGLEVNRTKAERSHPGVCPSRPHLVLPSSVGREKVNCPEGAREAGLGHDSARRFRDFARGISPPAGGELLCPWRQSNQNAPGDASDGLRLRFAPPRPIGRFPRTPFTGDTPEKFCKISGAQSQECLPAALSGPIEALGGRKFAAGAVQELRLGLPSQWNWCESRREAQGGLPYPIPPGPLVKGGCRRR